MMDDSAYNSSIKWIVAKLFLLNMLLRRCLREVFHLNWLCAL